MNELYFGALLDDVHETPVSSNTKEECRGTYLPGRP